MKRSIAIIALMLLPGCQTRVQFDGGTLTTNARVTAEYTVAADGAKTWKIDTMNQSMIDKLKTGLGNMINYLTRSLDQAAPKVGN